MTERITREILNSVMEKKESDRTLYENLLVEVYELGYEDSRYKIARNSTDLRRANLK